ncbi:MAG: hypothetical protein Kow0042_05970 [Calditrichia bacterium]
MEVGKTWQLLERIPEEQWDWKPHPKSWKMGELVTHLVNIPTWMSITLQQDSLDLSPPEAPETPHVAPAQSREEAADRFRANLAAAAKVLQTTEDGALLEPWTLLVGGKKQFTMPRYLVLRSFIFNHLVHHRAQLGVYLRLCNIPLPGMYGPSADEQ